MTYVLWILDPHVRILLEIHTTSQTVRLPPQCGNHLWMGPEKKITHFRGGGKTGRRSSVLSSLFASKEEGNPIEVEP